MRSVNKVILIGNVVHDPESKSTTSGHAFTSFILATNREWYSSEWENQSLAEFHKVVAWWKLAELCSKFLKKWKFIYIEGYLKTKTWEVDWKKMYRTEVVAQDMIMLNKKSDVGDMYEDYEKEDALDKESSSTSANESVKEDKKEDVKKWWDVDLEWDDI